MASSRRKGHGRTFEGDYLADGFRFAIVVARFNEYITSKMLEGCENTLNRHGVKPDNIDVVWVPGSFEIPLVAKKLAETGQYAAVICLGAVIRGETDHYDHVAGAVTSGVARVGLDTGVPTIFGILTTDTVEQALNRAGLKSGNNGYAAAVAAIETASLIGKVDRRQETGDRR